MKPAVFFAMLIFGSAVLHAESPALKKAKANFEVADAKLNKVYKTVSAELDKPKLAHLRELQRDWIAYRDYLSEASPAMEDSNRTDNPKATATYWKTMTEMTKDRIEFLQAFTGKNVPKGIDGEYHDDAGATVDLQETKKGVLFHITAVRGRSSANGELTGLAERNGDTAHYKQAAETVDDQPPCELVFTFIDGHILKIEEKSPDPSAGNGVHYDGEYYKTKKLSEPIKVE